MYRILTSIIATIVMQGANASLLGDDVTGEISMVGGAGFTQFSDTGPTVVVTPATEFTGGFINAFNPAFASAVSANVEANHIDIIIDQLLSIGGDVTAEFTFGDLEWFGDPLAVITGVTANAANPAPLDGSITTFFTDHSLTVRFEDFGQEFVFAGGTYRFDITASHQGVPEPAVLALICAGLAGWCRWRWNAQPDNR